MLKNQNNFYLSWILQNSLIVIILLSFISRMPQLLSENLILDGDESIVGIMSLHFVEGREIPIFFYGQSYGFALVEVVVISWFYALFGVTEYAVKLAMLFMWVLGVVFFYKTLIQIGFKNNRWAPLLITLLFVFFPAFAVWSMKARGGYLTAYLCFMIICYLLFHRKWNRMLFVNFFIGLTFVILYQSQPLWLIGLFPILVYHFAKMLKRMLIIAQLLGIAIGAVIFLFLKFDVASFWTPEVLVWPNMSIMELVDSIWVKTYRSLTGNYYLGDFHEPIFITQLLSVSMMVFICFSIVSAVWMFRKKHNINVLFYVSVFSVCCTLGYNIFIVREDPRYLLPLPVFVMLVTFFFIDQFKNVYLANAVVLVFIFLGVISISDFKNYSFQNKSDLVHLVNELRDRKIKSVFCEGGLLQWQIMFYTQEKTIARYKSGSDRYPPYIKKVNDDLIRYPEYTALVGNYNKELVESSNEFSSVKDVFFIQSPTNKEILIARDFDLRE